MARDMASSSSFREKGLYSNCALLFGSKVSRCAHVEPVMRIIRLASVESPKARRWCNSIPVIPGIWISLMIRSH